MRCDAMADGVVTLDALTLRPPDHGAGTEEEGRLDEGRNGSKGGRTVDACRANGGVNGG